MLIWSEIDKLFFYWFLPFFKMNRIEKKKSKYNLKSVNSNISSR